ncbi:MAG: hypothetical protein WD877_03005 [Candidatus Saccharimonadales bacterium]
MATHDFTAQTLVILGRQPALGLAELESLYGASNLRPIEHGALLRVPTEEVDFRRLGGTIKTARVLAVLPHNDWASVSKYLKAEVPKHLATAVPGKFRLGLSVYGLDVTLPRLHMDLMAIKKSTKGLGRSIRVVPNKELALSSAQVFHNKLTRLGAWELLLVKNGKSTILAQTMFVQDIEAYAARDQARPRRDAKVGMLPPKLAQIIVNLAMGQVNPERINRWDKAEGTKMYVVFDPFCGTGVILQEALLMNYSVYGTDIDPRMIEYTEKNLQWLVKKYPSVEGRVALEVADATKHSWAGYAGVRFSRIASEVYLGRPLGAFPPEDKLKEIVSDTNTVIKKFLINLATQLQDERTICLALPAWRKPDGRFVHLPLMTKLTDMGYNIRKFKHVSSEDLIYYRENQVVCRELVVLTKRSL